MAVCSPPSALSFACAMALTSIAEKLPFNVKDLSWDRFADVMDAAPGLTFADCRAVLTMVLGEDDGSQAPCK